MSREFEYEGPSIWSWATFARIRSKIRLTVSKSLTPTTDVMLTPGFAPTYASEEQYRRELEEKIDTWAADAVKRTLQCPAQHPVIPYELRVTMADLGPTRRLMIQAFPNAFESQFEYVPVPFFLCVTCQSVYRLREVEDVTLPNDKNARENSSGQASV